MLVKTINLRNNKVQITQIWAYPSELRIERSKVDPVSTTKDISIYYQDKDIFTTSCQACTSLDDYNWNKNSKQNPGQIPLKVWLDSSLRSTVQTKDHQATYNARYMLIFKRKQIPLTKDLEKMGPSDFMMALQANKL